MGQGLRTVVIPEDTRSRSAWAHTLAIASVAACALCTFGAYAIAHEVWGKMACLVAARHDEGWTPHLDRYLVGDDMTWFVAIPGALVVAAIPTLLLRLAYRGSSTASNRWRMRCSFAVFALTIASGYCVGKHNVMPGGTMFEWSRAIYDEQTKSVTPGAAFPDPGLAVDRVRRDAHISWLWLAALNAGVGLFVMRKKGDRRSDR